MLFAMSFGQFSLQYATVPNEQANHGGKYWL
jgi:hypothetical protein